MLEFKTSEIKEDFLKLHPLIRDIVKSLGLWSYSYDKKPLVITESLSTPELDKKLSRLSPAHSEARAVDIRCHDWTEAKKKAFEAYAHEKYSQYGYLPLSGKIRRIVFRHGDGSNEHFHTAIGNDIIQKFKNKYPLWRYPVHKITKENKNGKSLRP
jgi:hypothetical protein